jgi:predicted phage terminase large subunit-like protein
MHFSPLPQHPLAQKAYHIEAPRKHGKSECLAINYPSWLIGNHPNIHITIVSKTASLAEDSLGAIVRRIETDKNYKEVFGDLKPKDPQKWTNQQIYINRGEISKFPTIHATGLYGPLTGGGNDLVIADDIIDEENVITRLQVEKASLWFFKVLLPTLFPWGAILVIGTRWSYADLYSQIIEKYNHEILRAIQNPEEYAQGKPAKVLWQKYWSIERLEAKRKEIGSIFFNCQYQNDPTSMEGDLLKSEWLHPWNEKRPDGTEYGPPSPNLPVYAGVDPSLGEGDYFGIASLAYDAQHNQGYLLDVWAEHMPFPDIMKHKLPQLNSQYHYAKIYMETNFWQKILTFMPELKGLPIVPIQTVKDKEARFIPMSSHFESKRVLVNPLLDRKSEFWLEWVQFPRGQHDDALDCTEMVVSKIVGAKGEGNPSYLLI